jgi:putative membrane protein
VDKLLNDFPFLKTVAATIGYSAIGLVFFALAFMIIVKVTPFSIRKEIEEDQNTSLAIVIGSVFIGIAMIISAAVHG